MRIDSTTKANIGRTRAGLEWGVVVPRPIITPMRLARLREPFDHPDWIYEIKHDGFRGLAYVESGKARLVSRNGHTFGGFRGLCSSLADACAGTDAVLDGEIVCLGPDGRAMFNRLLYRREEPFFYAFDLLIRNGRDLRSLPLVERKRILKSLVPPQPSQLLCVNHIAGRGVELFQAACAMDLEGIVAKWMVAPYGIEGSWIKIKNPQYSHAIGRREKFERLRERSRDLRTRVPD